LSVPFVLAGVLALLRAFGSAEQRTMTLCAAAAGISASTAALVKQNVVDVFVFAAAVALTRLGSRDRRRALGILARFVLAAVGTGIVLVGLAALRGTEPLALWDAVTTFRFESMSVIQRNATAANSARLAGLLWAGSLSMAPVVIAGFAVQLRRGARDEPGGTTLVPDLRWPACALLAWEVVSIAGGGSYWLHYLLVLVPGLVVLGASAAQGPRPLGRFTAVALALAVGSSAAATILAASSPQSYSTDAEVISYLRVHGIPGDTVVVAFGHPNINWGVGMSSPYPQLWSLPVRVQDPGLVAFQEVLRSVAAPTWVVVSGDSLGTWGVDATQADRTLRSDYVLVTRVDRYGIWLRSSRSAG
jgi:hypothetical protein